MVYNIVEAGHLDVQDVEEMARLCYEKFELHKHHPAYDSESVCSYLRSFIDSPNSGVFLLKHEDENFGFLIYAIAPSLYNSKANQLIDVGLQADPRLPKITQGKVMIKLIEKLEATAKENKCVTMAISIMPQFDISPYLTKRGYVLSDQIFVKGVL